MTPGTPRPTLFEQCLGFFNVPQIIIRNKCCETGPMVYRPYPIRLKHCLTYVIFIIFTGGLEVLIDGQLFQGYNTLTNISVLLNDSLAVSRPTNSSFLVTFPSGISVITAEIQGSLSIVFAAPTLFKGHTKGLLGTWNGNKEDDFLKPDGIILPSNATGRQIHFEFGLKCKLGLIRSR